MITYPLDPAHFIRKRRSMRRELAEQPGLTELRIAILGGVTTSEIAADLEVFLLSRGIRALIRESEYNRWFEDAVLDRSDLLEFRPDLIYVCTSSKNIQHWPPLFADQSAAQDCLDRELARFRQVRDALLTQFPESTVLQNNFEPCEDAEFIGRLNLAFAAAARSEKRLLIVDAHGLAARLGRDRWYSPRDWYTSKMAQTPEGAVYLANSLSAPIAALFGKAKKCLVLDLDNTLWGGVIGDDGVNGIQIGKETAAAEAYTGFQQYCKKLQERGVILAVCSKNEEAAARSGFGHPDSILKPEDFASFRANWNPKNENIESIARELNIGLDSLVFIDDNPAERALVRAQLPQVAVPEVGDDVSLYPLVLDETGYFETAALSAEDAARTALYRQNQERRELEGAFADYGEYLVSLEMVAEIEPFHDLYLDRIAQLTNKSNQFNLTTRRYSRAELDTRAHDPSWITLYGRLEDRFGDNGLISVMMGQLQGAAVEIDLWLMSCRVLKRDMELAMLDRFVELALQKGARRLIGVYLRTAKNNMVSAHYDRLAFARTGGDPEGAECRWELIIAGSAYTPRNRYIQTRTIQERPIGSAGDSGPLAAGVSGHSR